MFLLSGKPKITFIASWLAFWHCRERSF